MYLPAEGTPESMVKLYVVSSYAIDPRLMDAHREERFSVPLIKQVYPGVTVYNYAKQFHEDIWKRFGLTESACRLLHRMQASDAPSQLDDIFRKGVLNEPRAIEFGKLAIDDYEQFAENFSSMERTRKRVRQLEAIASEFAEYESAERGVRELSAIAPSRAIAHGFAPNGLTIAFMPTSPKYCPNMSSMPRSAVPVHRPPKSGRSRCGNRSTRSIGSFRVWEATR